MNSRKNFFDKSEHKLIFHRHNLFRKEIVMQNIRVKKNYQYYMIDGLTLCITWVILYSFCSLLFWIAPQLMLSVTSRLFHGMNFSEMVEASSNFGFKDYVATVLIGSVYTFVAGLLFSFIRTTLQKAK